MRRNSASTGCQSGIWDSSTNKKGIRLSDPLSLLAERKGLEPSASGVTGRRYNRLNYRSVVGSTGLEPVTPAV